MQECSTRHCTVNVFGRGSPSLHCNVGAWLNTCSFPAGPTVSAPTHRQAGQRHARDRGPTVLQKRCHYSDRDEGQFVALAHALNHFRKQYNCILSPGDRRAKTDCVCAARQAFGTRGGATSSDHNPSNSQSLRRLVETKAVPPRSKFSPIDLESSPTPSTSESESRSWWRPGLAWLLSFSLLVGDASTLTPAAQAFPFFGPSQEKDPVEPFVIYGTVE